MAAAKRYITNSLLVLSSVLLTLYVAQVTLTFKDFLNRHPGGAFDSRTKYEVYRDLKIRIPETTVYFSPMHWRQETSLYPLSGLSSRQTIHCNENGYYSIYLSDRYGFNNPDSEWDKAPMDYLLIGDSFTQGACVNEPDTISGNLRRLSKKSVLSLGMGGAGPLMELALTREYIRKIKPNTVFWLFFEGNDLYDLNLEIKSPILKRYFETDTFSQGLPSKQKEIDNKVESHFLQWESEHKSAIAAFFKLKTLRYFFDVQVRRSFAESASSSIFKQVLIKAAKEVKKENAKFVFVFIPSYTRYNGNEKQLPSRNEIVALIRELNIPLVDIHNEFLQKSSDPLSFFSYRGNHLTRQGYQIVAEAISKYDN